MAEQQEAQEQTQEQTTAKEPSQQEKVNASKEPSLVDHLTELRTQLIKSTVVFMLFFALVFSTINFWFPYVTKGHQLIILSPLEVVSFYMTISLSIAFGLSIPFVCYFIWKFLKPGLTEQESRFISLYSPVMLILFVIGIAFGYFVVNPLSYNFLTALGAINFEVMISAHEYVRFLLLTTLPIGLMFELPMVAMFLAALGLLTVDTLKKVRKWSYVSLAVVSALITPPDFISQLIVLIPMIGLYEISIRLVARIEKRDQLKRLKESATSSQ